MWQTGNFEYSKRRLQRGQFVERSQETFQKNTLTRWELELLATVCSGMMSCYLGNKQIPSPTHYYFSLPSKEWPQCNLLQGLLQGNLMAVVVIAVIHIGLSFAKAVGLSSLRN